MNTVTLRYGSGRLVLSMRPPQADGASVAAFAEPEAVAALALVETGPRRPDRPLHRIVTDPESRRVDLLRERDRGDWRPMRWSVGRNVGRTGKLTFG